MSNQHSIRRQIRGSVVVAVAALAVAGCSAAAATPTTAPTSAPTSTRKPTGQPTIGTFTLTSASYKEGDQIPTKFTCDGGRVSPALAWADAPSGVKSYVLIEKDTANTFNHWIVVNIPGTTTSLPEGYARSGNTAPQYLMYVAPCPPQGGSGVYEITLYALSDTLDVKTLDFGTSDDLKAMAIEDAIGGKVLSTATLTASWLRPVSE